jgi:hypothetical protein
MEYIQRHLDKIKHKSKAMLKLTGNPTADEWKHYAHALEHYLDKLAQYEAEIAEGLTPVVFFAVNTGDDADERVKVHLQVENGTVHRHKHAPERPERIDHGPKHVPASKPASVSLEEAVAKVVTGSFKRSGIKVTEHNIEAQFSKLGAGEDADVVHEIIHIDATDDTRVLYKILSNRLSSPEEGEVGF